MRAVLELPTSFGAPELASGSVLALTDLAACVVVQGLRKLSLYDVASGDTVSRGALGFDASALADGIEPGALPVT